MAKNENIDIQLNIDGAAGIKSVGTMRKEVRAMSIELQELETTANKALAMGDTETAEKAKAAHAERTKQMVELRNDISDTAKAQKYLDPGELLGGYVKLAQGAVGAFGAITAGMKLMGSENETVNAIAAQSATVIQFMMGLESARQMLIDAGGVKEIGMLVKTTALKIASAAATGVQTATTVAQTVATGAATAAQWLLNIAMDANPIGLIIIGVTALIAGFMALYAATGSLTEALMWMVNPLGMLAGLLWDNYQAEQADNTEKEKGIAVAKAKLAATEKEIETQKKTIATMEKKLETMKAQGATEQELYIQSLRISAEKLKLADTEMKKANEQYELSKRNGELSLVDFIRIENAKKAKKEAIDADAKIKEDKTNEDIKKAKEKAKQAYDKKIDDEKAYRKRIEDIQDEAIQNEFDRNEAKINRAAQRDIEALNKNAKNYATLVDNILKQQEKALTDNDKAREAKRVEAETVIQDKVKTILIESLENQLTLITDSKEKITKFNEISAVNEANAIAEFEKANQDLKKSDFEAYQKGLNLITSKYSKERSNYKKDIDKEEIDAEKNKQDAIKEIRDKINDLKKPKLKEQIQNIRDDAAAQIEEEYKKWGKLKENESKFREWEELKNKETLEKISAAKDKAFEDGVNKTLAVANQINGLLSQASENRLANIDKEYSEDKEKLQYKLDNQLITQAEFDEQSAQLEKKKNDKVRIEKEKAWKRQHAADIANAVAQAAIAVAQVFALEAGELVVKSAAAAIAGSIAAANVALIAAQPMPKFAKGGPIGGQLHTSGGTILEAEAGEFIVNRRAMANPGFASIVASINNAGNSPSMSSISSVSSGSSGVMASIDPSVIDQIVSRIASIPVNVSEGDITTTQRRVNVIETRSIIG